MITRVRASLIGLSTAALLACSTEPDRARQPDAERDAGVAGFRPPDGDWLVTQIDGRSVREGEFTLVTRGGDIRGGYNGCNSWSLVPGHPGLIESTLQPCGKSPRMNAYDAIALSGNEATIVRGDNGFQARAAGHILTARLLMPGEQFPRLIADGPVE